MLFKSVPSMRSYESEGALRIDCNPDASANFTEGGRSFVDLDIDVIILEETKC